MFCFLGDSAYPLLPFLFTPVVGALPGSQEANYTRIHIRVRNSIERTIGLLKEMFRCIHSERVLHYSPQKAAKIIYCSAILYNYRLDHNELPNDNDINIIPDGKFYIN